MEALEGQKMNIFNDEQVHNRLKTMYGKVTPKGNVTYSKADRVFRFYRSLVSDGYLAVKESFSAPRTFYDNLNLLLEAGFSKAQLQNLQGNGKDNVVPLLQVIEIDFSQQRPVGYVEPKAGDITKLYGLEDVVLHLVA
jgi:II/X family phage/plasmid replication protein